MSSTKLSDCVVPLMDAYLDVKDVYEDLYPGHKLVVTCTYRSPEEQTLLYQKGRRKDADGQWVVENKAKIVTYLDGILKKSNHNSNPSTALDFMVTIYGKPTWEPSEYKTVGTLAEQRGLVFGGSWSSFKDYCHLEWATT